MMPMVFCASFEPCESAMKPAETIWSLRKARERRAGRTPRVIQKMAIITTNEARKPTTGETTRLFTIMVSPATWTAPACPRGRRRRPGEAAHEGRAAGTREGMPKYQVTRFRKDGADERREDDHLRDGGRRDQPLADGVRDRGAGERAAESSAAAMRMAVRMGRTPVLTTVAMALAVSWKPLM